MFVVFLVVAVLSWAGKGPRRSQPRDRGGQTSSGGARIHDGDTLSLAGTSVRFFGMDAPELRQSCTDERGRAWECGEAARDALIARIGSRDVRCDSRSRDRYGRVIGVCFAGDENLNEWMVREGWAFAYREYSTEFVDEELVARAARRGIWRGRVKPPWDWRRERRTKTRSGASSADER